MPAGSSRHVPRCKCLVAALGDAFGGYCTLVNMVLCQHSPVVSRGCKDSAGLCPSLAAMAKLCVTDAASEGLFSSFCLHKAPDAACLRSSHDSPTSCSSRSCQLQVVIYRAPGSLQSVLQL